MKPQVRSARNGVLIAGPVGLGAPGSSLIETERRHGACNYEPLPVVMTHGEGVWLWDEHGRRYLDMLSAYSAESHGHAHPRIVQALIAQAQRLAVTSRAVHTDKLPLFLKRLTELTGLDRALPVNTGVEAVETALAAAITPHTAAFLVEPIQGEGGIVVPPAGYLAECARICREHRVLLLADEIQTGMGRTGKFLTCEHEGVVPDGVALGKALGGG